MSNDRNKPRLPFVKDGALFLACAAIAFALVAFGGRRLQQPTPQLEHVAAARPSEPAERRRGPAPTQPIPPGAATSGEPKQPLQIGSALSPFQQASLEAPDTTARLNSELILSLRTTYAEALRCYSGPDPSVLEYHYKVRARGLTASVLGASFVRIKRGAPIEPPVIECVSRALNRPAELRTDSTQPFPEALEVDIPVDISLGPAKGGED